MGALSFLVRLCGLGVLVVLTVGCPKPMPFNTYATKVKEQDGIGHVSRAALASGGKIQAAASGWRDPDSLAPKGEGAWSLLEIDNGRVCFMYMRGRYIRFAEREEERDQRDGRDRLNALDYGKWAVTTLTDLPATGQWPKLAGKGNPIDEVKLERYGAVGKHGYWQVFQFCGPMIEIPADAKYLTAVFNGDSETPKAAIWAIDE